MRVRYRWFSKSRPGSRQPTAASSTGAPGGTPRLAGKARDACVECAHRSVFQVSTWRSGAHPAWSAGALAAAADRIPRARCSQARRSSTAAPTSVPATTASAMSSHHRGSSYVGGSDVRYRANRGCHGSGRDDGDGDSLARSTAITQYSASRPGVRMGGTTATSAASAAAPVGVPAA